MGRFNSHLWVGIGIWVIGANIAFLATGLIMRNYGLNKIASLAIGIVLAVSILWLLGVVLNASLGWILKGYPKGSTGPKDPEYLNEK